MLDIIAIIALLIILLVIAILLLNGKGGFLIAGFDMLPKEKRSSPQEENQLYTYDSYFADGEAE